MRSVAILAVVGVCVASRVAWATSDSCVICHSDVKTEYETSVHAATISCAACHGGDATVPKLEAHDTAKGYRGKIARADVPAVCASCHADPERMRDSGLPVDQFALYQNSEHGTRLKGGDTRVAVCTDCHGVHRIVSHTEPTSPVAPRNIAATCGRCHSDAQLMGAYKLPADQEAKYRDSVHGRALYLDDHPLAPTCATCHGAHGAREDVSTACGRCHSRTRDYFDDGPHAAAVTQGKMTECASCHGYHELPVPDRTLFETACPTCHAPDSPPALTARKLAAVLTQAEESLEAAEDDVATLERTMPTAARRRSRLDQARSYYLEALPVQHALNVERVEDLARSARSISDEARSAMHEAQQEYRLRHLWLAGIWGYVLAAGGVAYLYRRERLAQRRSPEP